MRQLLSLRSNGGTPKSGKAHAHGGKRARGRNTDCSRWIRSRSSTTMAKKSPPSGSAPARTDSGPADPASEATDHAAGVKKAQLQQLAAAMPHNPIKSGEHG